MKKNIWNIQKSDHGKRLLSFLKEKESALSSKELRWAIEHNFCTLNGIPERFASTQLKEGNHVFFYYNSYFKISTEQISESRIIYEDDFLLVYDKPPFLTSVGPQSLESLLKTKYPSLYPVHRLDRDTTGLLLFAKTTTSKNAIENAFKNRIIKKSYLAIVSQQPKSSSGIIKNYLGEIKKEPGKVTMGVVNKERGLWAETEWKMVQEVSFEGHSFSLIRCFPSTGRTHQIRVHLKSIGHPLLGDHQYGGSLNPYFPHYFLHAESLSLPLFFYNEPLLIKAPTPQHFISMGLHSNFLNNY